MNSEFVNNVIAGLVSLTPHEAWGLATVVCVGVGGIMGAIGAAGAPLDPNSKYAQAWWNWSMPKGFSDSFSAVAWGFVVAAAVVGWMTFTTQP